MWPVSLLLPTLRQYAAVYLMKLCSLHYCGGMEVDILTLTNLSNVPCTIICLGNDLVHKNGIKWCAVELYISL